MRLFKKKTTSDKVIKHFIKCRKKNSLELSMLKSLIKYYGEEVVKFIDIDELQNKILNKKRQG